MVVSPSCQPANEGAGSIHPEGVTKTVDWQDKPRGMKRERHRGKRRRAPGVNVWPSESVILVGRPPISIVWPKYVFTLGIYALWRRRNTAVLTDRRVLVGKGIVSRKEQSIPIDKITDATYMRRGLAAYCEVASAMRSREHVERVGPLSARLARRLTDGILDRC
jgi:Bacterial PH domain